MSYSRFLHCDYLDAEVQPASMMLHRCVQEPNQGSNTCMFRNSMKENMMDTLEIQRGHERGIESDASRVLTYTRRGSRPPENTSSGIEGFANRNPFITDNGPGESLVPEGQCPDGYSKCANTGRCLQVCQGCKYRDNMKSQSFNEADPCFPNGVFDGYNNNGDIKCTCGYKNTYCPDTFVNNFSADGSYIYGRGYRKDIGVYDTVMKLFHL